MVVISAICQILLVLSSHRHRKGCTFWREAGQNCVVNVQSLLTVVSFLPFHEMESAMQNV